MTKHKETNEPVDPIDAVERNRRKWMLRAVVAAVAIWGGLLATGSYIGIDEQTPSRDFRRFLVMAGCTGSFLALWIGALLVRRRL